MRLIINLPKTAFNSIDWWGEGDPPRAGVIPNQTGCVNGVNDDGSTDDVGPKGERFNGALTVTIIKHDTPADALELNVPGEPEYGWRVKVTAAPNPFAQWVLAEYTMFWHHPNGECYNDGPGLGAESAAGGRERDAGSRGRAARRTRTGRSRRIRRSRPELRGGGR